MHHHNRLIFVFLVEMAFHYLGQAGLKLLTSGDPSALAPRSVGITDMSHRAWWNSIFMKITNLGKNLVLQFHSFLFVSSPSSSPPPSLS